MERLADGVYYLRFFRGELRGRSELGKGFKILHRILISILPKLERLTEGIHTKHKKRGPLIPLHFPHLGYMSFLLSYILSLLSKHNIYERLRVN